MDNPRLFSRPRLTWFAPAEEFPHDIYQSYLDLLVHTPRKMDILINATDVPISAALMEQLALHPKVRTIILAGVPKEDHLLIAAEAALRHINLRFSDGENETQMLLNKRRSQIISLASVSDQHPHLYTTAAPAPNINSYLSSADQ